MAIKKDNKRLQITVTKELYDIILKESDKYNLSVSKYVKNILEKNSK